MDNFFIHFHQLLHKSSIVDLVIRPLFEKAIKILSISGLRIIQVIKSLSISFQSRLQRVIGFDR